MSHFKGLRTDLLFLCLCLLEARHVPALSCEIIRKDPHKQKQPHVWFAKRLNSFYVCHKRPISKLLSRVIVVAVNMIHCNSA